MKVVNTDFFSSTVHRFSLASIKKPTALTECILSALFSHASAILSITVVDNCKLNKGIEYCPKTRIPKSCRFQSMQINSA